MIPEVYGLRLLRQAVVLRMTIAVVVTVVLGFRLLQFVGLTGEIQWGYDFSAYWDAAGRLLAGAALYDPAQLAGPYSPQQQFLYLYPPPLAAAVTPLAAIFPDDYRAAAWAWFAVGMIVLAVTVLAVARIEHIEERYPVVGGRARWLLVAGAIALPPVVGELVLGNVHLLLLGLFAVAWLGIRRDTSGGEWVAGLAIGVATVIKVFPVLLFLWFLLTRRLRAAAGVLVGALAVVLVALPVTGIDPWLDYPRVLTNLSAPADTHDTLAPIVWLSPLLGFNVARVVVWAGGLLLVVAISLPARRDLPIARPANVARSYGAAVLLSVLIAPALYHHYLAIAVLPLLLGIAAGIRLRWIALAYFLLWGGQQDALGALDWVVNRAMPTLGALVLLAALVLTGLAWRPRLPGSATIRG